MAVSGGLDAGQKADLKALTGETLAEAVEVDGRALSAQVASFEAQVHRFAATTELVERGTPTIHTRAPSVPVGLFAVGGQLVCAFDAESDDPPEIPDLLRVYTAEGRDLRLAPNPLAHNKALSRWISDLYLSHRGRVRFVEVIEQPDLVILAFEVSHGADRPARRHLLGLDLKEGLSDVKLVKNPMPVDPPAPDFSGMPELDQAEWVPGERTNAYYNHVQVGPLFVFIEWGALKVRDHLDLPRGTADLVIEAAADKEHSVLPDRAEMLPTADPQAEALVRVLPEAGRAPHYLYYRRRPRRLERVDVSGLPGLELPHRLGKITSMFLWAGGEMLFLGGLPARPIGVKEAAGGPELMYLFQHAEGPYTLRVFNPDKRKVVHSFPWLLDYTLSPDGHLFAFEAPPDGGREAALEHRLRWFVTPFRVDAGELSPAQQKYLRSFHPAEVEALSEEVRALLPLLTDREFKEARRRLDAILVHHPFVERVKDVRDALSRLHESLSRCVAVETELEEIWERRRETLADFREDVTKAQEELKPRPSQGVPGILASIEVARTLAGRLEQLSAERHLPPDVIDAHKALRKELGAVLTGLSEAGGRYADRAINEVKERLTQAEEELPGLNSLVRIEQLLDQIRADRKALTVAVDALKLLDLPPERALQIAERGTGAVVGCDRVEAALTTSRRELSRTERHGSYQTWQIQLDLRIATEPATCTDLEECVGRADALVAEIETRKGDFADFPEIVSALDERVANARRRFEARKVELMRQRERALAELTQQFDLRLKALEVAGRTASLGASALEGFLAGHTEASRCQQIVEKLRGLGLEGQASALRGRLDQLRRLLVAERQERDIFSIEGETLLLGGTRFHRNRLDLSFQERFDADGRVGLALAGTALVLRGARLGGLEAPAGYLGQINETVAISRAEYLAFRILAQAEAAGGEAWAHLLAEAKGKKEAGIEALEARCRAEVLARSDEDHTLGLHDKDAALILQKVVPAWHTLGRLRYDPGTRVRAARAWAKVSDPEAVVRRARSVEALGVLFGDRGGVPEVLEEALLAGGGEAGEAELAYLTAELKAGGLDGVDTLVVHPRAQALAELLAGHLGVEALRQALGDVGDTERRLALLSSRVAALLGRGAGALAGVGPDDAALAEEVAWLLAQGRFGAGATPAGGIETAVTIKGQSADHPRARGPLTLDLPLWYTRLSRFHREDHPAFRRFRDQLAETRARLTDTMEIDTFVPRPLVRFSWTRLLRRVYLPLIAQALEKQLGSIDRPGLDQMGLLLLVSPPGYGKTELLKKVASLLGYAFVSVSGTSLGKETTSLDPDNAPDKNAAQSLKRLLLGLELRENLLLDIEDVQACSAGLLEKLLPLCDATRTVEIVRDGEVQRVDLQGRRVAIVMTLNPLKATIPQALANRATLINLGDVADRHARDFALSYLEVAAPVNPTLEPVATHRDLETLIQALEEEREWSGLDAELNGRYAAAELKRIRAVLEHCVAVRDVLMAVNRACLTSATVADAFRTEPAFELQGSYRDMVEICRNIEPDWSPERRRAAILRHYEGQAGLLGAMGEANLLTLKSMLGGVSDEERERLAHIRHVFRLHQQREQTLLTLLDRLTEVSEAIQRVPASVNAHGDLMGAHLERGLSTLAQSLTGPMEQSAVLMASAVGLPLETGLTQLTQAVSEPLHGQLQDLSLSVGAAVGAATRSLADHLRASLAASLGNLAERSATLSGEQVEALGTLLAQSLAGLQQELRELQATVEHGDALSAQRLQSALDTLGQTLFGHTAGPEGAPPPLLRRTPAPVEVPEAHFPAPPLPPEPAAAPEPASSTVQDDLARMEDLALSDPDAFLRQMLDPDLLPEEPAEEPAEAPAEAPVPRQGHLFDPLPSLAEAPKAVEPDPEPPAAPAAEAPDPADPAAEAPAPTEPAPETEPRPAAGPRGALGALLKESLEAATLSVRVQADAPPAWAQELKEALLHIQADLDRVATAAERPRPKTDMVATLRSLLKALPDDGGG